jgi:hypothetical protein
MSEGNQEKHTDRTGLKESFSDSGYRRPLTQVLTVVSAFLGVIVSTSSELLAESLAFSEETFFTIWTLTSLIGAALTVPGLLLFLRSFRAGPQVAAVGIFAFVGLLTILNSRFLTRLIDSVIPVFDVEPPVISFIGVLFLLLSLGFLLLLYLRACANRRVA